MKRVLSSLAVLTLTVALPILLCAAAPQEEASKPGTGDWNFVLTPLDANGNPGQSNISLQMNPQENTSLVYATC